MLVPLLRRWTSEGRTAASEWVAMGGGGEDKRVEHEGIQLSFVGVPVDERKGYALVKERMWELLNSNPTTLVPHGEGGIPEAAWAAFDAYQERSAEALRLASERMGHADLLYIHDFQQIGVAAAWKGPQVAKVFHLHTPFPSVLPAGWADYFTEHLRHYDAVIVSTRRYAENLRAAGMLSEIHVIHPFIDPQSYHFASPSEVAALRARFEIADSDRIILHVGRMDPMKGQDRLLEAMPAILAQQPDARLVLVGNGSFSSSKRGGLGLSKGKLWRADLEARAQALGITSRVTFTGHLGDVDLSAAYEACETFSLPSTREGFGLAAIEAWRHRKPVVVSDRAGVAELVEDGVNGLNVDASSPPLLAEALLKLLRDPAGARSMGEVGFETSRAATLDVGKRELERVFTRVLAEGPLAVA